MKTTGTIIFILIFLSAKYFAQSTTIKLPTTNDASSFNVTNSSDEGRLKLNADGGFYLGGPSGTIPITGAGARLMWHPWKCAFRVGYVDGTQWNDANVGLYSIAMGSNTKASGDNSTAMGISTKASGDNSTAMGNSTTATGSSSTAAGFHSTASGINSTAMGGSTTASGNGSTAIGVSTTASGENSIAIGNLTTASGNNSTAMGVGVSTNSYTGSFIIGDNFATITHNSSAANQMTMRFAGGYRFFTSSMFTASQCAFLNTDANAWSTSSDSTLKQNYVKADGEYFLESLSKLRLGSWNYKTQNPKEFRHYGPMAQEIFHYFGKDELGVIGNDTSLATADMDGIMMICLQALEKRTGELKKAEERIAELEKALSEQNNKISDQQMMIENFRNEFIELKNALYNRDKNNEEVKPAFTINK